MPCWDRLDVEPRLGLAGSSGGTDSREVEERWLADPDPGWLSGSTWGESDSMDLRLLALALRNLVEYLK
jgi:hypothetical protein